MPRFTKAYGWTDGKKIYLSLMPRAAGGARNIYDAPHQALIDASARNLEIEWEDVKAIDGF